MTDIPETILTRARVALAYAQTSASEGDVETAVAIIGKAIMAERENAAEYLEGLAHEGLHASLWERKFSNAAEAIRRGDA